MKILIVNNRDIVIGTKERRERTEGEITRVTGATIIDSNNNILVSQRSFSKKYNAGKWTISAAGTLEEGETYISNIIKEIKEELGVTVEERELIPSVYGLDTISKGFFRQMYFVKKDIPISDIKIQKEEVEQVKWIELEKLVETFRKNPNDFTPTFPTILESIIEFVKKSSF